MSEEELIIKQNKKKNIIIYSIYKTFSFDLLFYYATSFLFLHNYKGLSFASIVFADSFFPFFKVLFQIPLTLFIEKQGKRAGLILANLSLVIYMILILGCNTMYILLLADFFMAVGFVLKSLCESNILYDSLPPSNTKSKKFSKIDGRSSAFYYTFEAISCVISGFLYVKNPNIPMVLALVCTIISLILSHLFVDVPEDLSNINEDHYPASKYNFKHYIRNLKNAFRFIFSSNRLKSLIYFNAFFMALIYLLLSYRRSLLAEMGLSAPNMGIAFAVLGILASIATARSSKTNKRLKNKTLTYFGIYYCISIILSGLIVILNFQSKTIVNIIIIIMFGVQFAVKGPYQTLIKQYLSSFSTSSMRVKILSANNIIEGIITGLVSLVGAWILTFTDTAHASLYVGIASLLIVLLLLSYMKSRLGLQPHQYKKQDIEFKEVE